MAKQTINYGTTAGDGSGENLFAAFKKAKENFDELYGLNTELYANSAAFPSTGVSGKFYVAIDTGVAWWWTGSAYQAVGWNPSGNKVVRPDGVGIAALPLDVSSYASEQDPVTSQNLAIADKARVVNLAGLGRLRAALAKAEYGLCRLNCFGDSVTLGTYSNDSSIPVDSVADDQGYAGRLRAIMARKFGATAAGFMAANDSRNTLSGTGTVSATIGLPINTVRTDNVTSLGAALPLPAAATISFPVPRCTTIEIMYLDSNAVSNAGAIGANTGTFSYAVDGGGATTTTVDNVYPVNYKRITISGLSDTAHTLLLTGVTGTCYIFGICYYGANGVLVNRFGLGGASSLDLTGQGKITHVSSGGVQRILGFMGPAAAPVAMIGALQAGLKTVTVASTAGLVEGMPAGASANLPLPCYIESVDSTTQVTLSAAATGTNAAQNISFGAGTTIDADLWIIPIGHNDWQYQNDATYPTPVPIFTAQMQVIIDTIVSSGGCVLLVGEPISNNASPSPETYTDEDYRIALAGLAAANTHVAYVDIPRVWGTFNNGVALGLQSSAGGVHPLRNGSADFARIIARVLDMVAA